MKLTHIPFRGFLLGSTGALIMMVALSGTSSPLSMTSIRSSPLIAQIESFSELFSPPEEPLPDTGDGGDAGSTDGGGDGGDTGGNNGGETGQSANGGVSPGDFPGCEGYSTSFPLMNVREGTTLISMWGESFVRRTGEITAEIQQIQRDSETCKEEVQAKTAQLMTIVQQYTCALIQASGDGAVSRLFAQEQPLNPFNLAGIEQLDTRHIQQALSVAGITWDNALGLQTNYCKQILIFPREYKKLFEDIRDNTAATTEELQELQQQLQGTFIEMKQNWDEERQLEQDRFEETTQHWSDQQSRLDQYWQDQENRFNDQSMWHDDTNRRLDDTKTMVEEKLEKILTKPAESLKPVEDALNKIWGSLDDKFNVQKIWHDDTNRRLDDAKGMVEGKFNWIHDTLDDKLNQINSTLNNKLK